MSSILECKALQKRYGLKDALCGINLSLEPGRIIGLLGPNGSGKTTLIKLACGLLTPTGGEILIDGQKPSKETKAIVSYLPERMALPTWMTAKQAMDYYQDFYSDFRRDTAEDMLARLGLDERQTIRSMSKGMREKLQLILVMSRAAKLYLLDEPIGGVDPATRDYILKTIIGNYNEDAAVVISTHLIADVEQVLDEVVFLRQGNVVLHRSVDDIREAEGKSVDELFRQVFAY
ncbi:MAG: ABC transporter ATP-binding protein [Oscillospiraceae bacterium]|nr:ABC transporter ATP-binding protein [Oscillospiraceae bacterium]